MCKRTIEIAVGLFFLLGIAAFIMLAVKVSGLGHLYDVNQGYEISADFENVGGLKPRARVTIAGVTVGRVLSIDFNQKDYLAQVKIRLNSEVTDIPVDTTASILTAGLLGDNYIGLTPGFSEQFFKEGTHIPVGQTNKAVVLEELISRFVAGQASGLR